MAAAPWKLLVWACATDAERRCAHAHGLLTYAAAHLASPMHVADIQGGRARARLVGIIVTDACTDLASAATSMAAAEIFARRGGAANPATPLPSIDYLPNGDRSLWLALGVLQCAKVCAEDACDSAARCCGRLHTAHHLLGHQGLPGLDGIVDAERVAARGYLVAAQDLAVSSAELAATAAPLVL